MAVPILMLLAPSSWLLAKTLHLTFGKVGRAPAPAVAGRHGGRPYFPVFICPLTSVFCYLFADTYDLLTIESRRLKTARG
jgi:hypothetical protein